MSCVSGESSKIHQIGISNFYIFLLKCPNYFLVEFSLKGKAQTGKQRKTSSFKILKSKR